MLIPTTQRWATTLALLTLMHVLAGCGGQGIDEPSAAPAATTGQATVDASGGLVIGPDQVTLSIAPDTVSSNTTFGIARDASQAPPLVGMTLLSPIYAVTPHGSAFDPHALLNLPYDASKAPAGATAVVLRGEPDGSWHVLPNRGTQPGVALADVGELSWYAVGVCTPGDAGAFGFGIGDCPANHSLTLAYLDGQGGVLPVQRDALGRALPFMPVIEQPTDIALRLTWTRPAGVDRVDSIQLQGPYQAVIAGKPLIGEDVNQALTVRNATGHIDPSLVAGAGDPKGAIVRYKALAEYCWTGFIIGRGDNQRVCWRFDDDIAFRVHDVAPRPEKPIITVQPVNVSVVEGNKASFHVDASGMVNGHSLIRWWRRSDPAQPWVLAYEAATPRPGVTLSADGKTLTLTAHQAQDNGTLIRAEVCNLRPSGVESCADDVHEAQLTVTSINGPPTFAGPLDQSVPEHSTVDVLMTATGMPYATVEIWQLKDGVDTLLKTCTPARVTLKQIGGQLPPNPTVCSLHLPDPALHPADVLLADSGTQFYGKAISDTQANVTSRHATLTVTTSLVAPSIVAQPAAAVAQLGGTASFTATATGSAPLSYQWWFQAAQAGSQPRPAPVALSDRPAVTTGHQVSGIQGSGAPTLNLSNVQAADVGDYHLEVSNGTAPDARSLAAGLTVTPLTVVAVSAGAGHICAARSDGSVRCAGDNALGQLGDGSVVSQSTPTRVTGVTNAVALASGPLHTCALRRDGTVACWGNNAAGEIGADPAQVSSTSVPIAVPGVSKVEALVAGLQHTCALTTDGDVICWGDSGLGGSAAPTKVPGLFALHGGMPARLRPTLAAGSNHTCALVGTASGNATVACWGRNQAGQLGDGSLSDRHQPTMVAGGTGRNFMSVAAGVLHTCAIDDLSQTWCWGSNAQGQIGNGTIAREPVLVPAVATELSPFLGTFAGHMGSLTASGFHTCVSVPLTFSPTMVGNVACWGDTTGGKLRLTVVNPAVTDIYDTILALAVSDLNTCAISKDGSLWCWGGNAHGQLGLGTTVDATQPVSVPF